MTRKLRHGSPSKPSYERKAEELLSAVTALRRDAILEAIASSARVLLHSTNLHASLQQIAELLGCTIGVDRVHIIEIDSAASESGSIAWDCVWSAPGRAIPRSFFKAGETLARLGLGEWTPRLRRGESIARHTRALEGAARKLFERGEVKSVLCIPVFVNDRWWGIIGVDSCQSEREWTGAELTALRTLGELISTTIIRSKHLVSLADANRIVENSPIILYRLSSQPPYPLIFISQNIRRYGYEASELLASPTRWTELVDGAHLPVLIADIKSITSGVTDHLETEFRLRRADGSYAWFAGHGWALHDDQRRVIAIEGLFADIGERKSYEQRLTFMNTLLAAQLECSPDGILVVDDRMQIVSVNRRFIEMWQVPEHLLATSRGNPILPYNCHDAPLIALVASRVKNSAGFLARVRDLYEHQTGEARDELETTDGRFIDRYTRPLRDGTGRVLGRIWFFRDATDWKRTQDALRENEQKFRNIFTSVMDGIIIFDTTGVVIDINPPGCAIFGYSREELIGLSIEALSSGVPPYTQSTAMDWLKNMRAHGPQTTEWQCKAKDGHFFWSEVSLRGATFGGNNVALMTFRDITDRKESEAKIFQLARYDSLTGLANRATFMERLELGIARARRHSARFAVLYLDLDHFKDVNDTLGHALGDALLRAVGERLHDCLRETDLAARLGGDEFAVLQEDTAEVADAEHLATKIMSTLSVPYTIDNNQVRTTVSIGVVPYSDDVAGAEDMMMKADLALYRAKDEGRNQFRFHVSELDRQVRERVTIREDLRRAIERKEFVLWYQPQVELASSRIVGLEALIRWNHPTRGIMLPATFIPIAETSGSILAIGSWVVEQACWQLHDWCNQHIAPQSVAINLSAAQFKLESGLDRTIADELSKYNLVPSQLELELTETVLMETTRKHSEAFERLRQLGVRVAIDDFGTGYSNLDYLRTFRVTRLKIDKRFVEGVTINPDDAKIVRATIGLANELGIEVVAEGVETLEQRQFLITAGCKIAQGNYLGEPMPAERATALLYEATSLPAPSLG